MKLAQRLGELKHWIFSESCNMPSRRTLKLHPEPNAIVIWSSDNGPGIPKAAQKDAFQPFRRLDPSRNLETGGTGLAGHAAEYCLCSKCVVFFGSS